MEKLKNQSPKFQTQAQILHIHFLEKVKKGKLPEVARENFRFPVKQHRLDLRVLKAASKSYNFSLIFPIKQKKKNKKISLSFHIAMKIEDCWELWIW